MTIDEVLYLLNVNRQKNLLPAQELILRQSWAGKTYNSMATESAYKADYLRNIASPVWQLLSQAFQESINKSNFRALLEDIPFPVDKQPILVKRHTSSLKNVLEVPGGPMPLNSPFFIERTPMEKLAMTEIHKPGGVIRIKAPHKMGKSSLMLRITAQASVQGYQIAVLDFQQAEEDIFSELDRFLQWFCSNVSWQLGLEPKLDNYWYPMIGSKISCTLYLQRYLLTQINHPIVIALNEVDRIFKHPEIAKEFLPLIRSWHEEAQHVDEFQKLRFVVVHSTQVYIPLHINQSPFNVGLSINLPPLDLVQVQEFAKRHGLDWQGGTQATELMKMVGGHPYLIHRALYHLCSTTSTLQQLLQSAPTLNGIYSDHLRGHWMMLQDHPELVEGLKQVLHAEDAVQLDPILAYRLESMGIIKLDGDKVLIGCELYRLYFSSQL